MSGPERCVNPRCTQYGHIQDGACTFPPTHFSDRYDDEHLKENDVADQKTQPDYGHVNYPAGRHGDTIYMMYCDDCGVFVFNPAKHTRWHLGEPNPQGE